MLEFYFSHFKGDGVLLIFIEASIFYNLYQLMRQKQLIYFLLYKLLLIIYLGWLLFYFDLDIFAFILWIIYGGFISVVFILSFVWADSHYFKYSNYNGGWLNLIVGGFFILLILIFFSSVSINVDYYFSIFTLGWINFYEIIMWDYEEELEVLGWIIGFENYLTLIIISFILSLACLLLVTIISSARKFKYLNLAGIYSSKKAKACLNFKTQHFFIQEFGSVGFPKQALKLFHRRRI